MTVVTVKVKAPGPAYEGQPVPPEYLFTVNIDIPDDSSSSGGSSSGGSDSDSGSGSGSDGSDGGSYGSQYSGEEGESASEESGDVVSEKAPRLSSTKKVQKIHIKVHFRYAPKPGYKPPPYAPPTAAKSNEGASTEERQEVTLDRSNEKLTSTNIPCEVNGKPVDPAWVVHVNLLDNNVSDFGGLARFPNLVRLTLRHNLIRTLQGLHVCPRLRWLDISSNDMTNFVGMNANEVHSSIEWLDASHNNIRDFTGLAWLPNVTWLNLYNNDVVSLSGIERLPALRFLDVSNCNLTSCRELADATSLQEINLADNDLKSADEVMALARLPHLFRLNIFNNDLGSKEIAAVRAHFTAVKPQCEVNTTSRTFGSHVNVLPKGENKDTQEMCCMLM